MASFDEVLKDCTKLGTKIPTSEYLENGKHPIIDQGQNHIAGYYDSDNGLFKDVPAIVFGDHTRVVKYVDKPCFLGADGVKLLCPVDKDINCKYLFYQLSYADIPNTGYNRHFKWVKALNFKIPSNDEQNQVVEVLDKATDLISLRKQQLAKLDELVKARFLEMFGDFKSNSKGWSIVKFDEFAQIDGNMTTDYKKYADYPHIGIDSIEKGTGALKGYRTVKEDGVVSGKYIFTPQHIIYSKIRPNLNKVALPDFEGLCSADAYPILPNPKNCNRIFLALAMRSDYFLDYILQFSARTNLPKVNRKEIAGFSMPLPPLSLQNDFATFVERVDQQKQTVQQSLEKLELMKKALMQEYFG